MPTVPLLHFEVYCDDISSDGDRILELASE